MCGFGLGKGMVGDNHTDGRRRSAHPPVAVLHDQVDAGRGVQHVEEAHDVGVAVPLQYADLARHPPHVGLALDLVLLQDLDGHLWLLMVDVYMYAYAGVSCELCVV